MSIVAKWGDKKFVVSSSKITPFTGFSTSYSIKEDSNTDTSGKKKTNTRGRAAEEPSFSVTYVSALGVNARNEFTSWRKEIGKKHYIYIGTTKYGVNKFELKSADVSDLVTDNKGRTVKATVTLHFMEILPSKKKTSTSKKATESSKANAKNAKPSKDDAKSRKKSKKTVMDLVKGKK